jgi:hypothetical protein
MNNKILVAALLGSISLGAQAEGFAGGSIGLVGNPNWADDANKAMVAVGATSSKTEQNAASASLNLRGGYWLNSNFGAEGGMISIGEAKGTITTTGTAAVTGTTTYSYTTGALYATALGGIKLGSKGTLYGKVGLFSASTERKGTSTLPAITPSTKKASSTGLIFGAGYSIRVMNHLSIRPELTILSGVKFSNLDDAKPDDKKTLTQFSVGADYVF